MLVGLAKAVDVFEFPRRYISTRPSGGILNFPTEPKRIKPYVKLGATFATLWVLNGLLIGGALYLRARYYWEADHLEMIVTDGTIFLGLIAAQALLVPLAHLAVPENARLLVFLGRHRRPKR